ncbi:uncharacterized protein G2W53_018226 [Senna tora]|uniref:Uncharacterized protein n=1 Tax=Senna tora TaxID=362788 RepID=A0A834WL62_9FABA|nr:uncharacterized protein G2W53_018226 [Senna tora]
MESGDGRQEVKKKNDGVDDCSI